MSNRKHEKDLSSPPPSLLEISRSAPGFVFKKKPPKKVSSK